MNTLAPHELDGRVSEFETQAQADAYATWLQAEVERRMASDQAYLSDEAVMAKADALLAKLAASKAA